MPKNDRFKSPHLRTPAKIALGGIAGLLLTEALFYLRDGSAFPEINLYTSDAELGLRLTPGESERLAYPGSSVTSLRVNAQGFRGAEWPKPAEAPVIGGAILVIGDAAAFGTGVEEDETLAAVLSVKTGRTVLNAGVPTYGPKEYLALTKELLGTQHPSTVVVIVNEADDWLERNQPNGERVEVRDGWAVAKQDAPATLLDFPGSRWLTRNSHALYALRQLWAPPAADRPNLNVAATRALHRTLLKEPPQSTGISEHQIAETIATAAKKRVEAEEELTTTMHSLFSDVDANAVLEMQAHRDQNQPGDVIRARAVDGRAKDGSSGPSLRVTEAALQAGAKRRNEMELRLATWIETHRDDARSVPLQHALGDANRARDQLTALAARTAGSAPSRSPLAGFAQQMRAACQEAGAELIVVALPMDAQDNPLLTDLVSAAEEAGARALDATETIKELSAISALNSDGTGAFLDGSTQLAALGHAAIAEAVAIVLTQRAPDAKPGDGLPPGRSRVPTADEWMLAPGVAVSGAAQNHCATRQLREWLYVDCGSAGLAPAWAQLESGSLETRITGGSDNSADRLTVLTPLIPGRDLNVHLQGSDAVPNGHPRDAELTVRWSDGVATIALADAPAAAQREDAPRHAVDGARDPLPDCVAGRVNAGSAGACLASCTTDPCTEGACTDWMGSQVCL